MDHHFCLDQYFEDASHREGLRRGRTIVAANDPVEAIEESKLFAASSAQFFKVVLVTEVGDTVVFDSRKDT